MNTMQNPITMTQAATVRDDGGVEVVTDDASIRPDRYTFTDDDDLHAYLRAVLGGRVEGDGVRGLMSRKGTYSRRAPDGSAAVTFGDPILDAISSASGQIVVGGQTIDLDSAVAATAAAPTAGGGVIAAAASDLKFTGIVNGAERWASDDRSSVQYRIGSGRLTFHAWKRRRIFPPYWSMGAEISISGTNAKFEFADIESIRFMSATAPCQPVDPDFDSDRDDTYLDEYSWGVNAQQPERTVSRCRAQWHHAQFADVVTAGSGCDAGVDYPFDAGFPPAWTAIKTAIDLNGAWTDGSSRNAVISVNVNDLTVNMSAFNRPAAHGTIVGFSTITVTFPDDRTYTGQLEGGNRIRWSNGSVWTKIVRGLIDLNGQWTDGSARRAIIFSNDTKLTIDMSDYDRPAATGTGVDISTIKVKFPDEATHTGTLQPPKRIAWDNGSAWTKI
jgi:hypothetical protein